MKNLSFHQRGISLVESLIALLVISVGALAIATLQGNLVSSSGLSKARSEAVQIAQGNNEKLRNLITEDQYMDDLQEDKDSRSDIRGINAIFKLEWEIADVTSSYTFTNSLSEEVSRDYTYKNITSTVEWTDAQGETQKVVQTTRVAWADLRRSVAAVSDEGTSGRRISSPTGKGRMADGTETILDIDNPDVESVSHNDGLTTLIEGTTVQLVKGEEVLMVMTSSTPGQGFSTVSGRVYMDKELKLGEENKDDINPKMSLVLSSDASLCTRTFKDGLSDFEGTNFELDTEGPYSYYEYRCYFGEGWYGNIGMFSMQSKTDAKLRFCVGDPAILKSNAWDSRHPTLSTVRKYRGYTDAVGGGYKAVGIGLDPIIAGYTAIHYQHHNFLLTKIDAGKGKIEDADCKDPMSNESNDLFSMDANDTDNYGNPGKNFCMTTSCPGDQVIPDPVAIIEGKIAKVKDVDKSPELIGITFGSGECKWDEYSDHYEYSCETILAGWTGQTWSDTLKLQLKPDAALCSIIDGTGKAYAVIDTSTSTVYLENVPVILEDEAGNVIKLTLDTTISYTLGQCPVTTTITGVIRRTGSPHIAGLDLNASDAVTIAVGGQPLKNCDVGGGAGDAPYIYTCQIDWAGFGNTSWSADMKLKFNHNQNRICSVTGDDDRGVKTSDDIIGFANRQVPTKNKIIEQNIFIHRGNCPN